MIVILPLEEFEDNARVLKPGAKPIDFAFGRVGTVVRENVDGRICLGVLWDGATSVFEYPGDILFEGAAGVGGEPDTPESAGAKARAAADFGRRFEALGRTDPDEG